MSSVKKIRWRRARSFAKTLTTHTNTRSTPTMPKKKKNPAAVALGKKSAAKRKKMGHDSEYYKQLIAKRWEKKPKTPSKRI